MRATDMKYRDLPPNGFTLLENRVALTSNVHAAGATGDLGDCPAMSFVFVC